MKLSTGDYQATVAKITKINKRAIKRGWTGRIEVIDHGTELIKETLPNGIDIKVLIHNVTIEGEPPKYDDWTFLAKLDWDKNAGLIVRTAPGVESVDRSKLQESHCDHCNTNRYRKYTYLVANKFGKTLQVGSTCIKDFLGWNVNPVWIDTMDISEESLMNGIPHEDPECSTESVLKVACAVVKGYGYVKADNYENNIPTKVRVSQILFPIPPFNKEAHKEAYDHIKTSESKAIEVRNWVLSNEFSGDSEYVLNLKAIASAETCTVRNIGILGSAVVCYDRDLQKKAEQEAENSEVINEFYGEIKEYVDLNITITQTRCIDGAYGTILLYTMIDDKGYLFKWFCSGNGFDVEREGGRTEGAGIGDSFRIKGSVKKHAIYKGRKETQLTRCKIA